MERPLIRRRTQQHPGSGFLTQPRPKADSRCSAKGAPAFPKRMVFWDSPMLTVPGVPSKKQQRNGHSCRMALPSDCQDDAAGGSSRF